MEGIPNLSKERVDLCLGIVCPVELLAFAVGGKLLRAPVTALENKVRGHLKLVAVSALPLQRSEQVALGHLGREALAAAESSSLLHILEVKLAVGLALIITVVKEGNFLGGTLNLKGVPIADGFPILLGAVVSGDSVFNVVGDPPHGAVNLGVCELLHEGLLENACKGLCKESEFVVRCNLSHHLLEVSLYGDVGSEVQVLLKLIRVGIPLSVEVAKDEPVGIKELLGGADAESTEEQLLELEVSESVLLTAAYVIELSPEILGDIGIAEVCKKTAGILNGCPLKHAVYRNMEHDGIDVLENVGIKDTGLTKRYPMLKTGLGENALGDGFAYRIVIVDADFNRVTGSCPMDRSVSVARLSNGADVNDLDVVLVRLSLNGVNYISGCAGVGLDGSCRIIVCRRRNHSADMKDIIGTLNALEDVVIFLQVAPNNFNAGVVKVICELLSVLLTVAQKQDYVKLVLLFIELFEACPAHVAGCAGEKHCLFFCHECFPSICIITECIIAHNCAIYFIF